MKDQSHTEDGLPIMQPRPESPLLRAARQADLGEPNTFTLIVYAARLLAYVWAIVSVIVPVLDWIAGVTK